jgi:hypothetical protein
VSEIFKDWPRFDGIAAWANLTPEQQEEIGALALELVVASHGEDVVYRGGSEDAPESRPFLVAANRLFNQLKHAVSDMIADAVPALDDHQLPMPIPSFIGTICRRCGCCQEDGCEGGCCWAEEDLCSACIGRIA